MLQAALQESTVRVKLIASDGARKQRTPNDEAYAVSR
jgi:hypothetical protein